MPRIEIGSRHVLGAELHGDELTARADGAVVWEGVLGSEPVNFDGPVGLRTDNARFEFEYFTGMVGRAGRQ